MGESLPVQPFDEPAELGFVRPAEAIAGEPDPATDGIDLLHSDLAIKALAARRPDIARCHYALFGEKLLKARYGFIFSDEPPPTRPSPDIPRIKP